jgi:protein-S-isoprenylcysteine O-methyltransferase Ste14
LVLASIFLIGLAGLAFGGIHTALAANRVKNWARRRWGTRRVDRWYRLFFSLASILTFLPVLILPQILPDHPLYTISNPWVWLTSGMQLVALTVFAVAVFQTDVWRFIGLRQLIRGGEPVPADRHERLVTSGPYRWVRHPLYSTAIVVMLLWPQMTVNLAAFFAVSAAYFYLGSIPEEEKLIKEFGEAYRRYQQAVPRLIPRPWRAYSSES